MVVYNPLGDLVGTGADGILAGDAKVGYLLHGLLIHNGHCGAGKLGNEACIGGRKGDGELGIADHGETCKGICLAVLEGFRAGNFQRNVVVYAAGGEQTLKGILNVRCGQGAAVGEYYAFTKGKGVGQAILGGGIAGAEAGHYLGAAVVLNLNLKETVEDIHGNHVVVSGLCHVHGGYIVQSRYPEQTLFHLSRGSGGRSRFGFNGCGFFYFNIALSACGKAEKHQRSKYQCNKLLHWATSQFSDFVPLYTPPLAIKTIISAEDIAKNALGAVFCYNSGLFL